MVNTPPDDQMSFHQQLFDFVDKAQPGTRIAVFVNSAGLHMLQGFTSDHTLLRAALLSKGPGPHMPDVFLDQRNYGLNDPGAALSNLHFIADYMSGIPGRKNLLWLSSSFPIPVGPIVTGVNAQQGGVGGGFSSSTMQINDLSYLLQNARCKQFYAALHLRSQISSTPSQYAGIQSVNREGHARNDIVSYKIMDIDRRSSSGEPPLTTPATALRSSSTKPSTTARTITPSPTSPLMPSTMASSATFRSPQPSKQ